MPSSSSAPDRRAMMAARILLVGYLFFVGFNVWLPASVSAKVTGLVGVVARLVADAGIAPYYPAAVVLEILANVAMFVPIGVLLPLAFRRLRLWHVAALAGALSVVIETVQSFMPSRYPSISDVLANTSGAVIGCLLLQAVLIWWSMIEDEAAREVAT